MVFKVHSQTVTLCLDCDRCATFLDVEDFRAHRLDEEIIKLRKEGWEIDTLVGRCLCPNCVKAWEEAPMTRIVLIDRIQAIVDYFISRAADDLRGPPFHATVTRESDQYKVVFTVLLGGVDTATLDGGEFFVPVGDAPIEDAEQITYATGVAQAIEEALYGWFEAGRRFQDADHEE